MSHSPTIELPPATAPPPPPGHRRRRVALIAGAAALVLAVPPTLYYSLHNDSARPAVATPSAGPLPATSAPSTSPSVTPGTTTAPATPAAPAPDGRISAAVLNNATLNIPPWPTDTGLNGKPGLSGPVKFTNGGVDIPGDSTHLSVLHMNIDHIAYGDVDRDGAQETVANIFAGIQGGSQQLVAFDRDRSGRIITLGSVLATTGPIRQIARDTFQVQPNGVINARVGDYAGCCGDQTPVQWQWRSYAWNGQSFHQVGGPTAFPVNPNTTETSLTTGDLISGPAIDGVRHGTLSVTVSYLSGTVPDHLSVVFYFSMPGDIQPDGSAWPPTHPVSGSVTAVDLPTPAPGVTKTYTLAFRRPENSTATAFGTELYGSTARGIRLSETNQSNNYVITKVRNAG
jgi:hypothetical protein